MAMKRKGLLATGVVVFVMASCAVITVNIYFPEKDVQDAYKALEKELMGPARGEQEEQPMSKPEGKPESSIGFELVPTAHAQDRGLSEKIAEIVKKMPDVVNAYREIGARRADIDRLRESGAVGEGNNGMLVVRDEKLLSPADRGLIDTINQNRRTVIQGMTKAIIRINRAPENEQNLKQVMPQAVEQFAALRRDSARKGWWIQNPDGNWVRK
jgi:uncharacterized protein YdbL (DUF1318 family)